jgi:predicted permease
MNGDDEDLFWLDGQPKPESMNDMLWSLRYIVEPDYLSAMGIPLERGRFFSAQDDEHAPRVAVIDEVFARTFFPNQDPIGRKVNIDDGALQIVGIIGHVHQWGLDHDDTQTVRAQLYRPFMQMADSAMEATPSGMSVVVHSSAAMTDLLANIRQSTARLGGGCVIYGAETMEGIIARSLAARRFTMALFGVFALAALALASIGIYGVLSHLVAQRTHEIGVRMALGAQPASVAKLVIGEGLALALIGVGLGVVAAFGLTRLMASLLYGVSPVDPPTFAAVGLLLVVVALAACWMPARRATRADSLIALRSD